MRTITGVALVVTLALLGCGSDAVGHGIGAACSTSADCKESGQTCLPFKGGYCGVAGCKTDAECPSGSECIAHTDGKNYCFLICTDKSQCNAARPAEVEANCSSNVTSAESKKTPAKACVPPS